MWVVCMSVGGRFSLKPEVQKAQVAGSAFERRPYCLSVWLHFKSPQGLQTDLLSLIFYLGIVFNFFLQEEISTVLFNLI